VKSDKVTAGIRYTDQTKKCVKSSKLYIFISWHRNGEILLNTDVLVTKDVVGVVQSQAMGRATEVRFCARTHTEFPICCHAQTGSKPSNLRFDGEREFFPGVKDWNMTHITI
jgi:hypothetical protein